MHLFSANGNDPRPTPEVMIAALATYLDRRDREFQAEIRDILAALAEEEEEP